MLITTIGGATSNSYIDLVEADLYFDAHLNTAAWTGATADNKIRALIDAARRLQAGVENWLGTRSTSTKRMAWPRIYVEKIDPVTSGFGYSGGGGYWYTEYYANNEIPQQVKDAQCELALKYLDGFNESAPSTLDSFTVEGVTVRYTGQAAAIGLPDEVSQLIAPLTAGAQIRRG